MSSEASIAITRPAGTSRARCSVTRPVPQPTSSTVASGSIPTTREMTSFAHRCWGLLVRS